MRIPILSFDGNDLMVFMTATKAEAFVEPPDVYVGTTYDADGQLLAFETDGRRTFLRETHVYEPDGLRSAIVEVLNAGGATVARDASLHELVAEASQRFSVRSHC
jgi:hypothetical protein